MSTLATVKRGWFDLLSSFQFLTRIPMPSQSYDEGSLARAVKFFPIVGLFVGAGAALIHFLLVPHLSRYAAALFVLVYLVLITGALHEDGLADVADGFGGGRDREHTLLILRDSRIGAYGALAIVFSIAGRLFLLASLQNVTTYLIVGHVLCRWTALPLSYFLPAARSQNPEVYAGQGARIAQLTPLIDVISGTLFSFFVAIFFLRSRSVAPILSVVSISLLSGFYYKRKIGGVTGDCFGATNQLAEIAVFLCGAWVA